MLHAKFCDCNVSKINKKKNTFLIVYRDDGAFDGDEYHYLYTIYFYIFILCIAIWCCKNIEIELPIGEKRCVLSSKRLEFYLIDS